MRAKLHVIDAAVADQLYRDAVDPAPERKDYVDFRVLITTYVEIH